VEGRVIAVQCGSTPCRTRLPFRFGITTLRRADLVVARVEVEFEDGQRIPGYASDLLVPKWFDKNPATSADQDQDELVSSIARAASAYREAGHGSIFQLWHRAHQRAVVEHPGVELVDGFGVALLERALMDAACRGAEVSFFDALRGNLFGFEPGQLHPELMGFELADCLGDPLERVTLRHTVGLADPLRRSTVTEALDPKDGLPVSLDEDIRAYGLNCFKLKISGEAETDRARLCEIARVVQEADVPAPRFTLDGNEQIEDLAQLVGLMNDLEGDPDGRTLLEGLLYIEQPLPRHSSLDPDKVRELPALSAWAPILIDEADANTQAFPRALDLGYQGVSVKNCKGVFRALLNRALCEARGGGAFQASEDLTNLPVLALQQDLALLSALGLEHTERNGHHYFAGLAHLPEAEARAALQHHPDLYQEESGEIRLRIEAGTLALGSLRSPGFGYGSPVTLEVRDPLALVDPGAQEQPGA